MKKKYLIILLFLITVFSYSDVVWNAEKGRISIFYKIVDPLIVQVEQPERLIVSANQKTFSYSEINSTKKPLTVTVSSSYKRVDELLRKIYEKVYFNLEGNGEFNLVNTDTQAIITAKGYFIDQTVGANKENKMVDISKDFISNTSGNQFTTTTSIDADFTLPVGDVPMGIYRGTLHLNVWFGGTIQ